MIAYFVMFTFPFFIPLIIGGIVGKVRKSWTPVIVGMSIGVLLEWAYYVVILSQMVIQ